MIKIEEQIGNCGKAKSKVMKKEESKALREAYEDSFIKRFQPSFNTCI